MQDAFTRPKLARTGSVYGIYCYGTKIVIRSPFFETARNCIKQYVSARAHAFFVSQAVLVVSA